MRFCKMESYKIGTEKTIQKLIFSTTLCSEVQVRLEKVQKENQILWDFCKGCLWFPFSLNKPHTISNYRLSFFFHLYIIYIFYMYCTRFQTFSHVQGPILLLLVWMVSYASKTVLSPTLTLINVAPSRGLRRVVPSSKWPCLKKTIEWVKPRKYE
jgi:hypothetical protein